MAVSLGSCTECLHSIQSFTGIIECANMCNRLFHINCLQIIYGNDIFSRNAKNVPFFCYYCALVVRESFLNFNRQISCVRCKQIITNSQDSLQCKGKCQKYFHFECIKPISDFDRKLIQDDKCDFYCLDCDQVDYVTDRARIDSSNKNCFHMFSDLCNRIESLSNKLSNQDGSLAVIEDNINRLSDSVANIQLSTCGNNEGALHDGLAKQSNFANTNRTSFDSAHSRSTVVMPNIKLEKYYPKKLNSITFSKSRNVNSNKRIHSRDKIFALFITRLQPNIDSIAFNEMIVRILGKDSSFKSYKLITRFKNYNSYYLESSELNLDLLLNSAALPTSVLVKPFHGKLFKNMIDLSPERQIPIVFNSDHNVIVDNNVTLDIGHMPDKDQCSRSQENSLIPDEPCDNSTLDSSTVSVKSTSETILASSKISHLADSSVLSKESVVQVINSQLGEDGLSNLAKCASHNFAKTDISQDSLLGVSQDLLIQDDVTSTIVQENYALETTASIPTKKNTCIDANNTLPLPNMSLTLNKSIHINTVISDKVSDAFNLDNIPTSNEIKSNSHDLSPPPQDIMTSGNNLILGLDNGISTESQTLHTDNGISTESQTLHTRYGREIKVPVRDL